jgi:hypothetical protein
MPTRVASIRIELDDRGAITSSTALRTEIKKVGEDSKQAAQVANQATQQAGSQISTAWSNVARATIDNITAQKNLATAMQALQKAGTDDVKVVQNLAVAQKAAADASARLAQANKDVAESAKKGAEEFNGIESSERRGHIAGQLLTRTMGIEMPKALETVLSRSKTIGPALSAAFNVSIFLAAAAAVFEVGKRIWEAAEAAVGMTEKVKELQIEMHKANQEKFFNPDTLEQARQHVKQINEKNTKLEADLKAPEDQTAKLKAHFAFKSTTIDQERKEFRSNTEPGGEGQKGKEELDKAIGVLAKEQNQKVEELNARASEAALKGLAAAKARLDDGIKVLDVKTDANQKPDPSKPDQAKVYLAEKKALYAEYAASVKEISRQLAQEQMQADDKVLENGLHDENRIRQEEKDRIKELKAEMAERLGISQAAVEKTSAFQSRVAQIHQESAEKIKQGELEVMKIQQQTNDQIAQRAESYLTGTAKILAAQSREISSIQAQQRELAKLYGSEQTQKRIQQERGLSDQIVAINESAAQQIKQAHRQAADEIAAAQEESALAAVPLWQRATAQIEIQLTKRLKAVNEEAQKEIESLRALEQQHPELAAKANEEILAIEAETQARRVALWDQANLKIREEHKRQVDQLAGELETVFDDIGSGNIGKRILSNMKKLFANIVAEWILSMGQMRSGAGNLLGSLVFGPGSAGSNVFGGGGGGNLIGGLFGGGSPAGVPGTPPFIAPPPGAGGGSTFAPQSSTGQLFGSSLGNIFGPGAGTAGVSAGSPTSSSSTASTAAALGLGGFFGQSPSSLLVGGGPLTTQSISSVLGDTITNSAGSSARSATSPGGLAGLSKLLSPQGLAGLGGLGATLLGTMGGTTGSIGGTIMGLLLTGKLGGLVSTLFGSIGMTGAGALLGGLTGGLIGFGLGQNFGGGIGALAGAGTGALTGFMVGGPVGAIIGGIIGLIGGIFGGIFGGSKRKKQANQLADSTILPDVQKIVDQYKSFQLSADSANQQLTQIEQQAKDEMSKLKGEGKSVFNKKVEPAIQDARKQIQQFETERQRRSGLTFGPPQFHDGGIVSSTVQRWSSQPDELLAVLKDGEFVVKPEATRKNRKTLDRMNSGETIGGNFGDIHIHNYEGVDEVYMRNKGLQMIMDAIRRAGREGVR